MDNNFQPIFDYIDSHVEEKISELRAEMATKADIQRILDAIDAFTKQTKDTNDKVTLLENKTERIEHWVIKAADKTGVPYNP